MLFRAAACTGALYHIDLYIVCGDLEGLEAGVYQFSPQDFSLRRLRAGDYRSVLVAASGEEAVDRECAVRDRQRVDVLAQRLEVPSARLSPLLLGQRHDSRQSFGRCGCSQDSRQKLVLGFVDASVNQLLGLDSRREAPLSLWRWAIHRPGGSVFLRRAAPLMLETAPLSKTEVDYPAMREMHEASSLESEEEVKAWREGKAQGEIKAEGERIKDEGTPQNRLFPLATAQ